MRCLAVYWSVVKNDECVNILDANFFKFLKFSLVGAASVVLNLTCFYFFVDVIGLNYLLTTVFAFFLVNLFGFYVNKNYSFVDSNQKYFSQVIRYYIIMAANLVLNGILMYLFVSVLRVHYLLSSLILSALFFFGNFVLHLKWTFAKINQNEKKRVQRI